MTRITNTAKALFWRANDYLEAHPILGNMLLALEGAAIGAMFALAI